MLNSKKLLQMAKQRQKMAALGRRIMLTRTSGDAHSVKWSQSIADRGHLFVYSSDGKRFRVSLSYLNHNLFKELFRLSEEEFGLPSNGPITLPCDASCMECIISMLRYGGADDVEGAMLMSIAGKQCSISSLVCQLNDQPQRIVYGF